MLSINFPLQMQGGDNSQAQFARGAHRALCPLSLHAVHEGERSSVGLDEWGRDKGS